MTSTQILNIGDRIYNGGDICNRAHFGTVIDARHSRDWGSSYEIKPDDGEVDRYWITGSTVSRRYDGHGGTRIVTEQAYYAWRARAIATMKRDRENLG